MRGEWYNQEGENLSNISLHNKGLRQCAKLHDFGEVVIVVVVPGQ